MPAAKYIDTQPMAAVAITSAPYVVHQPNKKQTAFGNVQ
jgi:hypothetical protein